MTKFILHGGTSHRTLTQMQTLFDEVVRDQPNPVRILLIFFAKLESDWPSVFEFVKEGFKVTGHLVKLEIANLDINQFQAQLQKSDAVFVYGGETDLLVERLNKVDPKGNVFRIPIYAGSSAGAHVLSKLYYRRSKGEVNAGFGILPIKLLVHYGANSVEKDLDWQEVETDLKAVGEDLPIYKIAEGKLEIIEHVK